MKVKIKQVSTGLLIFLSVGLLLNSANAQDGPFSFNGKTRVFTGNSLHWDATQDGNTNLVWSTWSDRYFKINGATFRQDGRLGIGLTNPMYFFHAKTTNAVDRIAIQGSGSSDNVGFMIMNQDGSERWSVAAPYTTNSLQFFKGGYGNVMVLTDNGKLGLGTTQPTTNLHIGNTNNGGMRIGAVNDPGNIAVGVGLLTARYNIDFSGYRDVSPDQIGARISALRFNGYEPNNALRQFTGLAFYTNPIGNASGEADLLERMRITPSGYVGIGTTNPDAQLAVKGTIHAEEVKVDLQVPGPDYVFEPTYQLPPLTEIESYIKANKHLPEVPSAKEMETNGINLSEMNMLLLKKVEELTLHIIDQSKTIQQQKQQADALQSRLLKIEKILNQLENK